MGLNSLTFNIDNGYLEGLVRGFKAGILRQADYLNLIQCETLEGKAEWCQSVHILYLYSINSIINVILFSGIGYDLKLQFWIPAWNFGYSLRM